MRHLQVELAAEARSVGLARRRISDLLADAAAELWVDPAVLAVSEMVTNAVVHTGSQISLQAWASPDGVRVEVGDASAHLPIKREYAVTSGTGRGLHLIDNYVDRWGAGLAQVGKVVWFELGEPVGPVVSSADGVPHPAATDGDVVVTLRHVPLLMHWAWQEHAQALLREYLLFALDSDPEAIESHAQASDALSVLNEQIPAPELPEDPGALLADALEPGVTAEEILVAVPRSSVAHFATLDSLLGRALAAASEGSFLGPPAQPEIAEMRAWICAEVARQSGGDPRPRPWAAKTDIRAPVADEDELRARYRALSEAEGSVLVTDEKGVIVAVTPSAVALLGYDSESRLLGRRVLVVIPERYHQAHIAGTTLNATNGRDQLLDVVLTVPVVRADGSEVAVELLVSPRRLAAGHRVFVGYLDPVRGAEESDAGPG